jgi:hypothetical protein
VVSSEKAGDGGPRLQFAPDRRDMDSRVATATSTVASANPVQEMSSVSWKEKLLWTVVVNAGLYGQRSET